MSSKITIAFETGRADDIEVVVTLPTFRRPEHLARTLDSLAAQKTSRRFAVVVMDNDDERLEGLASAKAWFESHDLPGLVLIAHDRGNCSAYNAGWATALEHFPAIAHLLVIDDDELAIDTWLETLCTARETLGVDMVGAPQIPVFEGTSGARWARHPVFNPAYTKTGPVPVLYSSGNVVIAPHVLRVMGAPYLDEGFNFIGGGDSDFYSRCRERGFSFGWCTEAPVMETTPARRTELSWLNARSLRNGAISAIIERRRRPGIQGFAKRQLRNLALLAASPFRMVPLALQTGSPVIGIYHIQIAIGRLMAEFGQVNEQYRKPEQN